MKRKYVDGSRWGGWTVLSIIPRTGWRENQRYQCRCKCGAEKDVPASQLYRRPLGCSDCYGARVETLRLKAAGRRRVTTNPNGVLVLACRRCGSPLCESSVWTTSKLCRACVVLSMTDKPTTYPKSIGTLARASGVTRQAVSAYIQKHGFAAANNRYAALARAAGGGE